MGLPRTLVALLVAAAGLATEIEILPITPKAQGAGPLFRILRQGKFGYIHRNGAIAIQPRFAAARDFFGGLASISESTTEKSGYIDEKGTLVIPCRFDEAGDFSEGVAPVRVGRKWGYIDRTGKFAVTPQFEAAWPMRDGMGRVEVWSALRDDRMKRRRLKDAPLWAFHSKRFRDEYFPIDPRTGFINTKGELAIPAVFRQAGDFAEGLAPVALESEQGSPRWGYLNHAGDLAISATFESASEFSERLAAVRSNGKWGYLDHSGRFAIPPRFTDAESFSGGLAAACLEDRFQWSFIDRSGRFVFPPQYFRVSGFSDGIALTWPPFNGYRGHSYRFIDTSGATILEVPSALWNFSDGLVLLIATINSGMSTVEAGR